MNKIFVYFYGTNQSLREKPLIKLCTFILLTAIAFNSFFYYVIFNISVVYVRYQGHELLARADRSSLETIKIPAKDFDKGDPDDVWYDGKLYDVSDWRMANDTIYAHVLPDDREQALVSKMESYCRVPGDGAPIHTSKTPAVKSQTRYSFTTFFLYDDPPQPGACSTRNSSCFWATTLVSSPGDVITPPPRQPLHG